jgi:DNA polymerase I-like protein with 3'-5' exonuclease and polymerase domains
MHTMMNRIQTSIKLLQTWPTFQDHNLGLFYGMGKNKLQAELGVSKENADDLFRTYHDKVPFVKMLMESVMRRAQDRGRVRTLLGRRCRFNLW